MDLLPSLPRGRAGIEETAIARPALRSGVRAS